MEDNTRSDLACETCVPGREGALRKTRERGFSVQRLWIRKDEEEKYHKPAGEYLTVVCGKLWELGREEREALISLLSEMIRSMAEDMTGKRTEGGMRVLVAGLGNEHITSDAVGPMTAQRVTVTRHIAEYDRRLFRTLGCAEVSAISPGVFGITGLETVDVLRGAVKGSSPDLIVAIDALAAKDCERLAATVQISDAGIVPGSGIGNSRRGVDRAEMGVPVLSVGVPTVVDSATLVYGILGRAGIHGDGIGPEVREVLEKGRTFFVSPKESDRISESVANILAAAMDDAFGTNHIGEFGRI